MSAQWVLWGFCSWNPQPIKLAIGASRELRAKQRQREAATWTCAVYALGTEPVGLRLLAEQRTEIVVRRKETS